MSEDKPTDRAAAIRTWLMRAPRPAALQVVGTEGKEYDVKLKQGEPWSAVAISVAALNPERIEALSTEGNLLRACVVSDLVAKDEKSEQLKQSAFLAMSATDPETQRLIVFAELLQRTADKAIDCVAATYGTAFDRLAALAESAERRADTQAASAMELSIAIRNLMIEHAQETVDNATPKPEPSPLEQLASNFMAGASAAQAETSAGAAAAQAPTNGKAKRASNGRH